MACAWLVLLVMMLSRCVPFYCRQALLDMMFSPVEAPQVQFLEEVTVIFGAVVQTVQTVWKFRSSFLQGR